MERCLDMKKKVSGCQATKALSVLGGKWKLVILVRLFNSTKRFSELQRAIPGITTKMLTQQLRELEKDNLVHREVYKQVPPKVEYSLTDFGMTTKPIILALHEWGTKYMEAQNKK